jgi:D-beta-D-heptose 7-phosphate kinase/D-beta-D-heptose 1-phosphate adenosyltransferase
MTKVIVNGSFDILHLGHLKMLKYAKELPNSYLLVLIDSDERIRELKGTERPVNSVDERKAMLEAIRYVDEVKVFHSAEELEQLIKDYAPDVMVKGEDYFGKDIIGRHHCKEIQYFTYLNDYSTTKKIQSIINRRQLR